MSSGDAAALLVGRCQEAIQAAFSSNTAAGAMIVASKVVEEVLKLAVAEDLAAGRLSQAEADAASRYLTKTTELLAEMSKIYRAQFEKSRHEAGALKKAAEALDACGSLPDRPTDSPTPS